MIGTGQRTPNVAAGTNPGWTYSQRGHIGSPELGLGPDPVQMPIVPDVPAVPLTNPVEVDAAADLDHRPSVLADQRQESGNQVLSMTPPGQHLATRRTAATAAGPEPARLGPRSTAPRVGT